MTIFVDQDNTLNDFIQPVVEHVQSWWGKKDFSLTREECTTYHLLEYAFEPDKVEAATHEMFSLKGFWETMPIQPFARDVMYELNQNHDLYIVTCPWHTSDNCIPEKIKWIEKHLPFFDRRKIIFACDKKHLSGNIIIDDSPKYLNDNNCDITIAFDYPYNRNANADYRAKDWQEILEIIERLSTWEQQRLSS